MKLKFKVQPYQTNAVEAVVDCFAGQPKVDGLTYRIDPGQKVQAAAFEEGFKNADFALSEAQILEKDCQEFRVWAGIMGKKESHYVPTQRTCDPV